MAAISAAPLLWATLASSAVSTVAGMANSSAQAKAQASAQAQQKQALDRQYADAEKERQDRLARSQAAQRAAFAASGVSGDGSAGALMNNLLVESEQERSRLASSYNDQLANFDAAGRINLLRQREATTNGLLSLVRTGLNAYERSQTNPTRTS